MVDIKVMTIFDYHLTVLCVEVKVVVKEGIVKHQFDATLIIRS